MSSKIFKTILVISLFYGADSYLGTPLGTFANFGIALYGVGLAQRRDVVSLKTALWYSMLTGPLALLWFGW
jgi:hypothetical protein